MWKKKYLSCLLLATFVLVSTVIAHAAETEDLSFQLEQVVVTATKTQKQVRDTPATVEVITAADMQKQNVKRISDALKLLPGIYVRQPKGLVGSAETETITMRGFTESYSGEQYVAFLMDGQPINMNGGINLSNIPIEMIERIEVMRGASSALYGSDAMGGVINIITKEKPENTTILKMTIGEMHTRIGSISHSGSTGKMDYFLYGKNAKSDGYTTDLDYLAAPPNSLKAKYPGKNGMDSQSYNAKVIYHFDENSKLSIAAGRNNHSYFWEYKPDSGDRDETRWSIGYENQLDERNLLKVSYNEKKEDKTSILSSFNTKAPYYGQAYTARLKQIDIQHNYRLSKKDLLTVGYAYEEEKMDSMQTTLNAASQGKNWSQRIPKSDKSYNGKTSTQAIYLQNEHRFDDQFILYLGIRYDDWKLQNGYKEQYIGNRQAKTDFPEIKATNFSPKVGLTYHTTDKLTLRTSIAKAFRAPGLRELLGDMESERAKYMANPHLKPEESVNYEIGADYQFDKNLLGRLTVFTTDFTNRIVTYASDIDPFTGKTINQRINADKSRTKGLELALHKRFDDRWTTFMNYTYTDAKFTKNTNYPETEGKQIDYIPKNMFNLGINYQQDQWQASLTGNYISDPCEDRGKNVIGQWDFYFVMDLKVSYRFNPNTQLSLSVDNLLDKEYFSRYLAEPRTTYIEFSQKF